MHKISIKAELELLTSSSFVSLSLSHTRAHAHKLTTDADLSVRGYHCTTAAAVLTRVHTTVVHHGVADGQTVTTLTLNLEWG